MGKIKKTTKARSKTSEARRAGRAGRRNSSRESVAVSNEHLMLAAMAATYTSLGCQSEGRVLLPVKTKNRVFSAVILYFSVLFFT